MKQNSCTPSRASSSQLPISMWIAARWSDSPSFQSLDNLWSVATAASFIAVAAAGQALAILTGGIDLSVPWVMTWARSR